jgi:hypothetical protein
MTAVLGSETYSLQEPQAERTRARDPQSC